MICRTEALQSSPWQHAEDDTDAGNLGVGRVANKSIQNKEVFVLLQLIFISKPCTIMLHCCEVVSLVANLKTRLQNVCAIELAGCRQCSLSLCGSKMVQLSS